MMLTQKEREYIGGKYTGHINDKLIEEVVSNLKWINQRNSQ